MFGPREVAVYVDQRNEQGGIDGARENANVYGPILHHRDVRR
jgi:hypothetical protein